MPFDHRTEQSFRLQFNDNIELALQQLGPKLRPYVTEISCSGEGATAADIIGDINALRLTGRQRTNIENPVSISRRWLVFRDEIGTGQYMDSEDKLRQITSPDSQIIQAHAAGIGRAIDEIILGMDEDGAIAEGGIMGTVVQGKRPGGAGVALPAAQTTVHASTGLTMEKLRKARMRLAKDENNLDSTRIVMAITPAQMDNLFAIVQATSANLNQFDQAQIVDGKVKRALGIDFIETNLLPISGTTRSCPMWTKANVVLGIWKDVTTGMWNDTHARNTPYASITARMDCTRIQDKGVHVIECAEA